MGVIEDEFDPHSAWLHDIDPLAPLDEAGREGFLRFVEAVAAMPLDPIGTDYDDDESPTAGEDATPVAGVPGAPELDFVSRPGLSADALAAMAPDAELAAELEEVDITEVDEYYLVEVAAAYQRMASWSTARLTHVAGELARRPLLSGHGALPSHVDAGNMAADELAPRLGLSRFATRRTVRNAYHFSGNFALTGHALATGQIDANKASTIVTMLEDYPSEIAVLVQDAVIDDAALQTHSQLVAAIRRAVIAVSHDDADWLHAKARAKRRVDHPRQLPDGMASLLAILPATDAAALDLALEAAARTAKQHGDQRTLDQLRADTLALMGHGALENGYVGLPPGARPTADRLPSGEDPPAPPDRPVEQQAGPVEQQARPVEQRARSDEQRAEPVEQQAGPVEQQAGPQKAGSDEQRAGPDTPRGNSQGTAVPPDGSQGTGVPSRQPDSTAAPPGKAGGRVPRSDHMPLGQVGGQRTQVRITVPLSVLMPPDLAHQLGLPPATGAPPGAASGTTDPPAAAQLRPLPDQDAVVAFLEREPADVAELEGYGPISPAVARAAALGGTWRRIVTDPLSGTVLDYGRNRYRPPAALAELVRLRDGTCVRAGCSSPARTCELDHVHPWSAGGSTALINLACVCTREHLTKTSGAFQLRHLGGGDFEWSTPSGHTYRRHRGGRISHITRNAPHTVASSPPF